MYRKSKTLFLFILSVPINSNYMVPFSNLKTRFFYFLFLSFITHAAFAGEGMWLPLFLKAMNEADMQSKGLKLTAEDIYSINKSCLKDAIVQFNGGCTAEVISDKGFVWSIA